MCLVVNFYHFQNVQLEYAALDAAVLVHVFCRFNSQSQTPNMEGQQHAKVEWKSHIVSYTKNRDVYILMKAVTSI